MNAETIELYRGVQKYRGEWRVGDRYFDILNRTYGVLCEFCDKNRDGDFYGLTNYLWLPPVWSDDGRNLWAMVDWEKWGICVDENRRILIHERKYDIVYFEADTLPEALLRAIGGKGE